MFDFFTLNWKPSDGPIGPSWTWTTAPELDLDEPLPPGPADTDDEGVPEVRNDVVVDVPPETDPEAEPPAGTEP